MTPRENALLAYQHKQPEWLPMYGIDISILMPHPEIERYNGLGIGKDYFGVEWKYVPELHAPMTISGNEMLKDITQWREVVKFPDLEAIDWVASAERDTHMNPLAFQAGEQVVPLENGKSIYDDGKLISAMVINGPLERLLALMGFDNAMMALIIEPEACADYFSAMVDYKIELYKKIKQYYKVDIINQHDDLGGSDRMFMSLDTFRSVLKPHMARLVKAVHDLGFIYQHHSCGYIEPLIPDFVEIGVDALDSVQACNTNILEYKKRYGDRLTLVGGIDNQHIVDVPGTSEEAIRKEYHRAIDLLAPGGSFVAFPGALSAYGGGILVDEHFKYGVSFYANHK